MVPNRCSFFTAPHLTPHLVLTPNTSLVTLTHYSAFCLGKMRWSALWEKGSQERCERGGGLGPLRAVPGLLIPPPATGTHADQGKGFSYMLPHVPLRCPLVLLRVHFSATEDISELPNHYLQKKKKLLFSPRNLKKKSPRGPFSRGRFASCNKDTLPKVSLGRKALGLGARLQSVLWEVTAAGAERADGSVCTVRKQIIKPGYGTAPVIPAV